MADMVNGFAHIGVPCTDLEKSVSFYEEFGFRAAAKARDLNGYHVVMMENSGCIIELYESADAEEKEAAGQRSDGHVDHIALRTEDLDRRSGQSICVLHRKKLSRCDGRDRVYRYMEPEEVQVFYHHRAK